LRVILDTNVFVSGAFFAGPPHQILKAWRNGRIQILVSEEILKEYHRVGEILLAKHPEVDLGPFIELLVKNAELTQSQKLPSPICDDPDDDKFLACALAGKSKIIISGDKHMLKIRAYKGVKIVRPRKFVDDYLKK
jgi:putative PIN family toxin of toxin-antitoxin system